MPTRNYSKILIFAYLVFCQGSCKLLSSQRDGALEGDSLAPATERENLDAQGVPVSLWSPAQREASAGYYFLVAELMALRGELDKALPVIEAAYNLDPKPFLGGKLIATKASVGDKAEALNDVHRLVLMYPKDASLRMLYAQMLVGGGKAKDAIEQLDFAIKAKKEFDQPYLLLAAIYHQTKQTDKAIATIKQLLAIDSASVAALAQLSKLYLAAGKPKDALEPARRAYDIQSQSPELALVLAIALELNNKSKEAMQFYEQLYRLNPTNEELTARMVMIYHELGNLEDALKLLDDTEQAAGKSRPGLAMQKAIVLWELKRFKEAAEILDTLAIDNPESDRVVYMAALGQERVAKPERAIELFARIAPDSSLRIHADFRRAILLKELKRQDEAEKAAQEVVARQDATHEAYLLLANIYGDANKFKEAETALHDGYTRFPNQHRLLFLKGVYQERAGEYDNCMSTMRQVIEADPQNSGAFNFLGYMYAERGERLDEAERLIKRALEIKPNDGYYLDSLGWVHYQRGDYKTALELLEKAVKLEPDEGAVMEHLADVKMKLGEETVAEGIYQKSLEKRLEPKDKLRIEDKLKKLQAKLRSARPAETGGT